MMDRAPSQKHQDHIEFGSENSITRIRSGVLISCFDKLELHTGMEMSYYENGILAEVKPYQGGRLCGQYIAFYENGRIKETACYDNSGALFSKIMYYADGTKHYEEIHRVFTYEDGVKLADDLEYKIIEYYKNGQKSKTGWYSWHYDHAEPYGRYRFFYPNGKLKEICYYIAGIKGNVQMLFDINGKLSAFHVYEFSKYPGEEEEYFKYHFNNWEWSYRVIESSFYRNGIFLSTVNYEGNEGVNDYL